MKTIKVVLILVVMEDGLVPPYNHINRSDL